MPPSGSFRQVYVKCPFYKHDDGCRKIVCEGLVPNSNLTLSYGRKQDYLIQMETFCCGSYQKCEVHQALMTKYEED